MKSVEYRSRLVNEGHSDEDKIEKTCNAWLEGLLKDVTPIDWKPKPLTKHPLIMVKPEKGHVVISEQEHEEYKKFLAARGTRKSGNQFDEEGRRFRP